MTTIIVYVGFLMMLQMRSKRLNWFDEKEQVLRKEWGQVDGWRRVLFIQFRCRRLFPQSIQVELKYPDVVPVPLVETATFPLVL